MEIEMVAWERLIPDPNNPRKKSSKEDLAELISSIIAHDIKVPLIGYRVPEEMIMIWDGHRRWEAAKRAGKKTLPTMVFPKKPTDADVLLAQMVINEMRSGLNPIDRYEGYVKLAQLKGWSSPSEIAAGLTVPPAKVSSVLALGKLTKDERELVRQGRISESAAYALARMPPEQRAPLVAKAATGELTRDALNAKARRQRKPETTKSQRIYCQLKDGSVSVRAASGLNLTGLINLLDELVRCCRKLRADGLDVTTAVRVLRDRSRAQPAT